MKTTTRRLLKQNWRCWTNSRQKHIRIASVKHSILFRRLLPVFAKKLKSGVVITNEAKIDGLFAPYALEYWVLMLNKVCPSRKCVLARSSGMVTLVVLLCSIFSTNSSTENAEMETEDNVNKIYSHHQVP